MLQPAREQPSTDSADELRIRLEGAYEVLERARDRYAHAESVLRKARFRSAVRDEPALFDELLEKEPKAQLALQKAEALCERAPSPDLRALIDGFKARRAALHKRVETRLRQKTPAPFEQSLKLLQSRIFAELPGDIQPGERRLGEGVTGLHPALAAVLGGWFSAYLVGPEMAAFPNAPPVAMGVGVALLMMLLAGYWALRRSGTYTLTNRRLIWRPRRGEPSQVELKTLGPSDVKLGMTSIRVAALVPFKIPGLGRPRALLGRIEALRMVQQAEGASSERLVDAALFPAEEGATLLYDDGILLAGVAVMRPSFAAFFRNDRSAKVMGELTGYRGKDRVELYDALQILRQLPEEKFDELVRAAAGKHGLLLERSQKAHVSTTGPVWQHLVVTDGAAAFNAKVTWRHLEEVEAMVAQWRRG